MSNSRLIVRINDRDALPVRALPHLTGPFDRLASPQRLAEHFSGNDPVFGALQSFRFIGDRLIVARPDEWNLVEMALQKLKEQLDRRFPRKLNPKTGFTEITAEANLAYRRCSVKAIPEGTLVWRDEYEAAFTKAFLWNLDSADTRNNVQPPTVLRFDLPEGATSRETPSVDATTTNTVLDYDRFDLSASELKTILAGFENGTGSALGSSSTSVTRNPSTDDEPGLTKRERQIRAIEAGAKALEYEPSKIPNGGKKAIMNWCKDKHAELFGAGDSPFKDAWKDASRGKRVTMADRAKFAGEW
ncbi:hypothetical protein [Caballeronia sp. NCTM1]|uniref:hypothetical protein n=1 Tax=Caballeronia sp. NCTM1 TaxID=2921753 RepID=UPI002028C528|nr:hypothetical protein [Caballeronia sp. NCTM1]